VTLTTGEIPSAFAEESDHLVTPVRDRPLATWADAYGDLTELDHERLVKGH
jgi:hypothetical protein